MTWRDGVMIAVSTAVVVGLRIWLDTAFDRKARKLFPDLVEKYKRERK